jgi:hypothetical protein
VDEWTCWAAVSHTDFEGETLIGLAQRPDGAKDLCQEWIDDPLDPWSEDASGNWSAEVVGSGARRYTVTRYTAPLTANPTT